MGVDTDFGCGGEVLADGVDAIGHITHGHRAAGVDDVDARGSVALHQLRLLGQRGRGGHVAHHQEAHGVHA